MNYPYVVYNNSSILLSGINLKNLPSTIEVEGNKLFVKDEFHITLAGVDYLASLINDTEHARVKQRIFKEFDDFVNSTLLDEYEISTELRLVQTGKHKTIIVIANVQNLDKFFDRLSKKFSVDLPQQVTHITLYRYPKDFIGIPIPTLDKLNSMSKIIELSRLIDILDQHHQP